MEQVRNRRLDNICEAIGDARDQINAAKQEEQGSIQAALQVMQRDGVQVYRHARVELARIPGAEKLRVRMTKEEGDAGAADLEPAGEGEGADSRLGVTGTGEAALEG
jgi:hypothetical protein